MTACDTLKFLQVNAPVWNCVSQAAATKCGVTIADVAGRATKDGLTISWDCTAETETLSVQCTDSPWWAGCTTINSMLSDEIEACMRANNIDPTPREQESGPLARDDRPRNISASTLRAIRETPSLGSGITAFQWWVLPESLSGAGRGGRELDIASGDASQRRLGLAPLHLGYQTVDVHGHRIAPPSDPTAAAASDGAQATALMTKSGFRPGSVVFIDIEDGTVAWGNYESYLNQWFAYIRK